MLPNKGVIMFNWLGLYSKTDISWNAEEILQDAFDSMSWSEMVKNCNVDESKACIICNQFMHRHIGVWNASLLARDLDMFPRLNSCGRWCWLEFKTELDKYKFDNIFHSTPGYYTY